jgi:hypothetical protein
MEKVKEKRERKREKKNEMGEKDMSIRLNYFSNTSKTCRNSSYRGEAFVHYDWQPN